MTTKYVLQHGPKEVIFTKLDEAYQEMLSQAKQDFILYDEQGAMMTQGSLFDSSHKHLKQTIPMPPPVQVVQQTIDNFTEFIWLDREDQALAKIRIQF